MPRRVAVIGVGQTRYCTRRDDVSYPELVREAVVGALDSCSMDFADIEAAVFALAPDALVGVGSAERWCLDAIGIVDKPIMRCHTGGTTGMSAFIEGFDHVASGLFDTVLVVGADRVSESGDAQLVLNRMWDPLYESDLPLNAITQNAVQAVRYMAKYGCTEEHAALVSVKNHDNALRNPCAHIRRAVTVQEVMDSRPLCWPIKLFDACPQSTGACALVLAADSVVHKGTAPPAWIDGAGYSAETYFIGDRMGSGAEHDYADMDGLQAAVRKAYAAAGIRNPLAEIGVVELYAPFSFTEMAVIEATGVCPKGEAFKWLEKGCFHFDGKFPVNPSGGVMCANPIAVTALVRVAEAALQVQERAGDHQVSGVGKALASGRGGSIQFFSATVLSKT